MAPDKQLCANCSTLGNPAAPTCPAGAEYSLITEHGARTSLVGPGGHAAPLHLCPVPTGEPILIHTGQGQNLPPVLPHFAQAPSHNPGHSRRGGTTAQCCRPQASPLHLSPASASLFPLLPFGGWLQSFTYSSSVRFMSTIPFYFDG